MQTEQAFRFGEFQLLKQRRLLLENDRAVRLGSRALDLLTALLEHAGDIVSKEALMAYAWPTAVVEETSLRFHLSSLRKALGDGQQGRRFIANVSGRGYCFVAPVQRLQQASDTDAPTKNSAHNLPVRLTRIIGRSDLIQRMAHLLSERRFVTIAGPGGMGKSTLAMAVCEDVLPHYPDGVWFVDLSPLSDGALAVGALATALGISVDESDPMRRVGEFLKEKRLLIFLDNCEHLIDAAAALAENLLASGRQVHVLTTSREPLSACGEWLQRLPPLEVPARSNPSDPSVSSVPVTAAQALASSAVQLFVERATASQDSFELTDQDAPGVVDICRQLDGMPLAIELAAAHINAFGVSGLLAQMERRLPLGGQVRRAGPRRHQTLRALLDWSFDLLSTPDQRLLGRLAVFTGPFTMDAAMAVCADPQRRGPEILLGMESLASKSLVLVLPRAGEMHYRLLDTTRSYAMERLEAMGEQGTLRERQAHYLCEVMAQAERDWTVLGRAEWIATYSPFVDDVRAVLDWTFTTPEGALAAVRLTSLFFTMANALSFQSELQQRLEWAMERYSALGVQEPALEFRLCALTSLSLTLASGPNARADALLTRARALADQMAAPQQQVEAIHQLFSAAVYAGNSALARIHADALSERATRCTDVAVALAADRAQAHVSLLMGELAAARRLMERVMRYPMLQMPAGPPYPMSQSVSMRMLLARVLWLEGLAEQALDVAQQAQQLSASENTFSQGLVMSWAICPVALWTGDLQQARAAIERLKQDALRYDFALQGSYADEYERVLGHRSGAPVETSVAGDRAQGRGRVSVSGPLADFMATLGEAFLSDVAVARMESGQAPWCAPEVLRSLGERARAAGRDDEAVSFFERSLGMARQQGALAWELRAASSMARLFRDQGRPAQGKDLLRTVFERFTEGFETADLMAAARLLGELDPAARPHS
ncbi:ATP-binding protein [Roseateles depolymerans]|uniref:ATP-binding protein n=1 Tax=Roseateles depolymerans TaxID=76731 RepID=UPI0014744277|nr:winged helix-turn-helix domain-containing protein [Roseateles depolymerans]